MKIVTIILGFLAYVNCEPPLSGGYHYPNPGTGSLPLGSNLHGGFSLNEHSSSQSSQDSYNNLASSYDSSSSSFNSATNQISLDSQFLSSANSVTNQANNNNVQVFKHFYYHVAPEEPEEVKQRINIPAPPPQKHYKIIFIKAPSPPAPAAAVVAPQQQIEEKTLVYVLLKKPEDQEQLVLPTVAPTKPSKPEVYFIKYQAKENKEQISSGSNQLTNSLQTDISENFNSSAVSDSTTSGLSSVYGPPSLNYLPYK